LQFAILGSTGSGKTISIRLLMQSVLPNIGKGNDQRALIYDAKQDMISILAGINPPCEIVILNPFDKRGVAWDMAKDITAPATAQQIATILIPENKNASQPFFADAARHLLSGVLISFIKRAPEQWKFRDVLIALKSKERLKKVLLATPETSDLVEQYFSDDTTTRNVMSTVATKMQRYEFIAAAWERAEEAISLRDWLTGEFILVLGNDEATRTALDAINQVIFKRLSELILAQTESETRKTWIFLDEFRQAGKLEGLSSLLTKGRSKGASVILGYQDIEGLREVYGHQLANEIAGQCANKAILRCDSSDTAKWASVLFGEREVLERRESTSQSSSSSQNDYYFGGSSTSGTSSQTSEQVLKREVVIPSEIMDIPPTNRENGLSGYYLTPSVGAYYVTAGGDWIAEDLRPKDLEVLDIDPREEEDQYLRPWDDNDLERLGLKEAEEETPEDEEELEHKESENPLFLISRKDKIDIH
jgi:type IV secretory pathway TraG/TraD family ATPase VirD4